MGELVFTASHQATLIRYLTEAISLYSLKILILDEFKFCQGRVYHEQQLFVEDVKAHKKVPYVWHMCWTDTRDQKVPCIYTAVLYTYLYKSVYSYTYTCACHIQVGYYRNLGLWFLPEPVEAASQVCLSGPRMVNFVTTAAKRPARPGADALGEYCCRAGKYYKDNS